MALTIELIDQKIAQTQEVLDYWKKVREVLNNPLFAELSAEIPVTHSASAPRPISIASVPTWTPAAKTRYGELKRLTLECLPEDGGGITPQELADVIARTGFVFQTKTPAISVNDTLNTLRAEKKAKWVGKTASNAGKWLKIPQAKDIFDIVAESGIKEG
jgi:hypothetical protein